MQFFNLVSLVFAPVAAIQMLGKGTKVADNKSTYSNINIFQNNVVGTTKMFSFLTCLFFLVRTRAQSQYEVGHQQW